MGDILKMSMSVDCMVLKYFVNDHLKKHSGCQFLKARNPSKMELQFCHWLPEPQAISYHFQKHSSLEQITADVVNAPLDLKQE